MKLSLIVAYSRNRVIGIDNTLPWRLPADLQHFKRTTMGHPVIMGRKTWDSIGRPLPGRRNLVVTRDADWRADGAERVSSIDEAATLCHEQAEAFVIGGAQIYAAALPRADTVVATEIDLDVAGDTFFAELDPHEWREVSRETHDRLDPDVPAFAWVHYARRTPSA
jgi:dihydrofolate reductase